MILPITLYGDPVLRKVTPEIDKDYPELQSLIGNMFETMYNAEGVGLAAPQVGLNIRLFVVDATILADEDPQLKDFKKALINPQIVERTGELESMEEGCLSVPGIREDVTRPGHIRIQYYDEEWNFHDETYDGFAARVIQHEYDHLDGVMFVDHCSPLRKRFLKAKLANITKGKVKASYQVRPPRR
ncbi:peptide deformylase [Halosquirtibacter xylanolyticus]|uniref:peptide deformylase n=1 Tax=Halosquirtibacter xylanolyticus TaxID=3374599 RepID=UPI003747CC66|nr:peptide deformylase [Prolixibacteraceae bacterium]